MIEKPHTIEFFYGYKKRGTRKLYNKCRACYSEERRSSPEIREKNRLSYLKWRTKNRERWRAYKRSRAQKLGAVPRVKITERVEKRRLLKRLLSLLKWIRLDALNDMSPWMRWQATASPRSLKSAKQKAKARKKSMSLASDGSLTKKTSFVLLNEYPDCLYCGRLIERANWSLDHIVPIKLGGLHGTSNVIVCCKSCNSKRQHKDVFEFISTIDPALQDEAIKRIKAKLMIS